MTKTLPWVLLAGVVAGGLWSQPRAAGQPVGAAAATKWEYVTLVLEEVKDFQLDYKGGDGWELVTAVPAPGKKEGALMFVFKRPRS